MGKMIKETSKTIHASVVKYEALVAADPQNELKVKTLAALKKKYETLLTAEMITKGRNFETKHQGSDWWELITLQYPITVVEEKFCVTSKARDWQENKTWQYENRYLALAKIEQLIAWIAGGRKRGFGDTDSDIDRLLAM